MNQVPMTKAGYEKLRDELDRLKHEERPKNIQDIAEARAHGDLSENAEYHAAKERQGFINSRIKELEGKIASAIIVSSAHQDHSRITFGATVRLVPLDSKEEKRYTLVGQEEADLKAGRISVHSPVGKALIGHSEGETVTIRVPAGEVQYKIAEILYEGSG
ncbi:MAG: transcription elongation factor GreA [Nitrospirae bacterium]|jgi:transcription elongation factor GreA|nr:transcription elongation factor GreA [Nitrospirota bacterium]